MTRYDTPTLTPGSPTSRVSRDLLPFPSARFRQLVSDADARVDGGLTTICRALMVAVRAEEADRARPGAPEELVALIERAVADPDPDTPITGSTWGSAVEALGSVVRHHSGSALADRALALLGPMTGERDDDPRACAHAVLGAADVWRVRPDDRAAHLLLTDCLAQIPRRPAHGWGWPEPRLTADSAVLCSALIVGGELGRREATTSAGLAMLATLIRIETGPTGRLSITGTHGRAPGDPSPQWDQHPSDVAALADACVHALTVTRDARWARHVLRCWEWFVGENDAGSPMVDPVTGDAYDVLRPTGRDVGRGLAACAAALGTHQNARSAGGWVR